MRQGVGPQPTWRQESCRVDYEVGRTVHVYTPFFRHLSQRIPITFDTCERVRITGGLPNACTRVEGVGDAYYRERTLQRATTSRALAACVI